MTSSGILRANFTISDAAKVAIEQIRKQYDAQWPDNPAAVACVAWGIVVPHDGAPQSGRVIVGFYQRAMLADVAHGIQEVSGVKLIFFTTEQYVANFDGKVLDYADEHGFFMRAP